MPAKNSVKKYHENGHYHIYNRGADKREIFLDDHDYQTFLSLLKTYLSPVESDQTTSPISSDSRPHRIQRRRNMNLADQVKLLAYCLMPNHFHLLIQQKSPHAISQFMQRVCTSYVTYFNQKYTRSGTLFQGVYKAVLVEDKSHLVYLSKYIHLNPTQTKKIGPFATTTGSPADYPYSSYKKYLEGKQIPWLDTSVLPNSDVSIDQLNSLGSLILEDDT